MRRFPVVALVAILTVVLIGCGEQKSNADDLGLGNLVEVSLRECVANGEGLNGAGGHCDDGVTETRRFLARIRHLRLSDTDRHDLLTRAANDVESYCFECADMLDRVR